jgi:NADPH-dependent ferric siderophore reductase
VSVSRVSARLLSVLVSADGRDGRDGRDGSDGRDGLDGFADAAPTSHLKVFLPADGQDEPLLPEFTPDGAVYPEGPPPVIRTYTPRRYDRAAKTLEIQFLLHGDGPAAAWAQRAKPGDKLAVAGPGGRFSLEPAAEHWWLAADESAIPAVGTLLDALPETVTVDAHIEVDGPQDEIDLTAGKQKAIVSWHHRRDGADGANGANGAHGAFGQELIAAARDAVIPDTARVWVACEAAAMREIRRYLVRERGIPATRLVTRGYWRSGEQNHPDHDYGDD